MTYREFKRWVRENEQYLDARTLINIAKVYSGLDCRIFWRRHVWRQVEPLLMIGVVIPTEQKKKGEQET